MQDLMDSAIALDAGEHTIWQINRGLLSPLYLPNPEKLLSLPPGERRWQVFDFDLGPQKTANYTVTFGVRAWILALMGIEFAEEGPSYKALLYDAKKKRTLSTTRELSWNMVGSAKNPAWLSTPAELEPNSPLFLRITNLVSQQNTGQVVLYTHLQLEGAL